MTTRLLTAIASLAVALGFSSAASAAEETLQPATIIIYRAEESVKTSRLNPTIHVNDSRVGRIDRQEILVLEKPAGLYVIDSSLPGTDALTLELKPGGTYYVHSQLEMRGASVKSVLVQVEEQVARVQQPEINGVI